MGSTTARGYAWQGASFEAAAIAAGVVLAGGRSSRMGTAKAALEWHGSTLLRHVTGVVARAVDGPVVVVRAPRQTLPELDPRVMVCDDPEVGLGPMQGLAPDPAGLGLDPQGRPRPVPTASGRS